MSDLDCFQEQSRKPHYRHNTKPGRGRGRNFPLPPRYNNQNDNYYGGGHYGTPPRPPPGPPPGPPVPPAPIGYDTNRHHHDVGHYGPPPGGYDTKSPYYAKPAAKLTANEGWSSMKSNMKYTRTNEDNDKGKKRRKK